MPSVSNSNPFPSSSGLRRPLLLRCVPTPQPNFYPPPTINNHTPLPPPSSHARLLPLPRELNKSAAARRVGLSQFFLGVEDSSSMGILSLITGKAGASGFGSSSTAEQVTDGVDASRLTVIVTGGASGIGLETSRVFAMRGAHVIIAARNTEAASEARKTIMERNPTAHIDVLKLDLSSLKSVRAFADQFKSMNLPLNILINNAGVMFCPFQLSEDGVEMQFATNHLGHFLLTNLLLDNMKATAKSTGIEGRIVNLSSVAHFHTYPKGIEFDKINDEKVYNDKMAYGQSKLANLLHAKELSRRLKEEGANITVNSVHPGLIMTNLMRHSFVLMKAIQVVTYILWKNVPQGAATTCYVGLSPQVEGVTGRYFADCNVEKTSKLAKSEELAKQLWDFSEKLIKSAK